MLDRINPVQTNSWKKLTGHFHQIKNTHMKDLFDKDPDRFDKFSIQFNTILVDYSKNRIDEKTLALLFELARESKLEDAISKMFSGDCINETENRPVLHTALRNRDSSPVMAYGSDVMPAVNAVLEKMKLFSENLIEKKFRGYTGKPISDIVNIGIGGSNLGPEMVLQCLEPYKKKDIHVYFLSNIDGTHISRILRHLNPETTLFMIASKTFTTQETMTNAFSARDWFLTHAKNKDHVAKHFIALSANLKQVKAFGIDENNMFEFWDWVGGRFSLWSAIGLPIACSIGFDNFEDLLEGAHEMDLHFKQTPFERNIPVLLGLIGIWYNNFFKASTETILPYDQSMEKFPDYFQQSNMESNGKSTDRNGNKTDYQTGPVIWGKPGTNGQHAFFQLIHQGTKIVPADFLAPANSHYPVGDHHDILLSNFFAQTQALLYGKSFDKVIKELKESNVDDAKIKTIAAHKTFDGNRPSNSILFKKLTPHVLGNLISMYEHKIFVQGVIWNIFSFDQWGVELGKQLAKKILPRLKDDQPVTEHDSSTNGLINTFKKMKSS